MFVGFDVFSEVCFRTFYIKRVHLHLIDFLIVSFFFSFIHTVAPIAATSSPSCLDCRGHSEQGRKGRCQTVFRP